MSNPQFLIQQEPRLSVKEAEATVNSTLKKLGIKPPSVDKHNKFILKNQGKGDEKRIRYTELVKQVREKGICEIQLDLDKMDPVFGGSFALSTPNWQMSLTSTWAGFSQELKGPCKSTPSEVELSTDIEFYKEEACIESAEYDFELCARNYRGYLFSSLALIDSYINRHIMYFTYINRQSPTFEELKKCTNSERRVELFIQEFCNFTFTEFIKGREWDDFMKLKELRNEIVHAISPYLGISLKDVANNLNLSINGVGNFLLRLQEGQNRLTLTFIEQVRTSSIVRFNQVTMKAEGKFEEKMIFNKIPR